MTMHALAVVVVSVLTKVPIGMIILVIFALIFSVRWIVVALVACVSLVGLSRIVLGVVVA